MPIIDPRATAPPRPDLTQTPPPAGRKIGSGVMPFSNRRPPAMPDKLAAACLLANRGAVYCEDAVRALGWTTQQWWDVAGRCKEWFALSPHGWTLTDEGRRVVELYSRTTSPR